MNYLGPNNQPVNNGPAGKPTWLDHLINSNPQGVMRVLAGYGYTGYLAPQNDQEMTEVAYEVIDDHGEDAVVELLKNHPLYEAIREICTEEKTIPVPYKNATGEETIFSKTISTINFKSLAESALIIIGAIFLAGKAWDFISKKEE